jgi:release factor glutamine methyltransferase
MATRAAASVRDALEAAADALAAAGVETPRLDAELLLAEAAGFERAELAADPSAELAPAAGRTFAAMVRRRLRREPVAYILGRRGFRRIELRVDRRALIPRPETEMLVELAVERRPDTVLDVGTGSGAVALAVADELPDAGIVATDTSPAALELARENAERLGLGDRVRFERGTLPEGETFDLTLANLPYVREGEWGELAPEIVRHEPREALVAGPTGLEAIAALIVAHPAGALAVEVGAGQADAVATEMADAGFERIERRRDLAAIDRMVAGTRAVA